MVKIHLSRLLGERRMTQLELSRQTGIRNNTINDLYHEISVSVKIEHIDKICEVLNCSVSDLIEYKPNRVKKTGKNLIKDVHGNCKNREAD